MSPEEPEEEQDMPSELQLELSAEQQQQEQEAAGPPAAQLQHCCKHQQQRQPPNQQRQTAPGWRQAQRMAPKTAPKASC